MMKQHFNLLRMVVFAILFVAGSFPAPLFAKESATSARTRVDHASFCASIDTLGAKVADDIALRQAHDERKRTRDRDVLLRRLTGRDRAMADARSSWDSKRDQLYVKLEHRAKTDAQRAAIALFKTHVDTATRVRREAVEAAVSAFHASIDAASRERQKVVDDAIAVFTRKTQEALLKAKADCQRGVAPSKVRDLYTKEMKHAKEDLSAALKTLEKRNDALRAVSHERQAAVVRAAANFTSAIESAEATLRKAFAH
jgi:hypothetical protein